MNIFFIFCAEYLFALPVLILGRYFLMQPRKTWKRMATFALSAALLTYVVGLIGGLLYYDPRPFVVGHFKPLIPHTPDNGFPSDHALLVSAIAMIGTLWSRKLGGVLWIVAVLVAAARVYVGVHHTIDVVGSMVISIVVISAISRVRHRTTRPARSSPDTT